MELAFSQALQSIANPFLNGLMLFFTEFGDDLIFIAVAVLLYWCINKRYAFQFLTVYFAGQACVEIIKSTVARPRPFTHKGKVISIGEQTHGYSFPSGHSHSIANMATQLAIKTKKWYVIVPGVFLTVIVMFSRIYLGQHYLSDTLVGMTIGVGIAFLVTFLFKFVGDKEEIIGYILAPVAIILTLVFAFTGIANKGMMIMFGTVSAFAISYALEKKFVKYNVKSDKWWKYIVKVLIGVAVVFAIKEGFKAIIPLSSIENGYAKDLVEMLVKEFLRYFLLTFVAGVAMPALFKAIKL
ncbi:MAG: phosphatase PAP2 family protein [Clostridiales bacterium]|nr:phosphatase PAP2 family protein [Clostridiales bacterium]